VPALRLFAPTNVFKVAWVKRPNVYDFELPRANLFFGLGWRSQMILDTTREDVDSTLIQTILSIGSDGGIQVSVHLSLHFNI
jgi:aminopeptidase C